MLKKCLRFVLLAALLVPLGAKAQSGCAVVEVTSTQAFVENFDGTALPACWTVSGPGTWSVGVGDYSSSTGSHSGSGNALITHGTTGNVTMLISPVLDLSSLTSASLSFWYVNRSWAGDIDGLTVSYRTDTTTDNWTLLDSYTAGTSEWTEASFDLTTLSATFQLAFSYTDSYGYGVGLDEIRLGAPPTCFRVQSITATNVTAESMTITWVDTLNTNTYTLSYWPNNAAEGDTVEVFGISGNSYALSGLNAQTYYYFSIVPDCSTGDVQTLMGSAMTDCEGGGCDITVNAIDSYGDGWNGNAINVMQGGALIGSATIATGNSAIVTIHVCSGAPVTLTYTSGNYASEMGGTVTDGGGNTIFTIENMGSHVNGETLITVADACPNCIAPTNLTDSITDDGNVILSWSSDNSQFVVYNGDIMVADDVTDTFYTFVGLAASSVHNLGVASICDNGDTSGIRYHSVATPCGAIDAMPYSAGFENDVTDMPPMCWSVLRSVTSYSTTYPTVYGYNRHTGTNSVVLYTEYDDDTCMIVSSPITYNPGNLHVKFWAYLSFYYGSSFQAGIMTDTNDMSSFVALKNINSNSPDYTEYTWTLYEFFTDELGLEEGDTAYLVFRMVGPDGYGYGDNAYIDDIYIRNIPDCRMPLAGSGIIDSISHESAYFAWEGTSTDGYQLRLERYILDNNGTPIDTIVSNIFCDSTFITIDTLMANSWYKASVSTICDDGGETIITEPLVLGLFQTQMRCYPVYQAKLDVVTNSAAVISWNYRENMGIAGTGAIVTLNDLSAPTATPTTQTVNGATNVAFNGLTPGHTYSATIASLCGAQDTAEMQTIYFTTHTPECSQAFSDAQIGSYDYSTSTPIYTFNEYGYSQTIYKDTVLAGIDTLTGVAYNAYFSNNEYVGVNNFEIDMYVGMVDTSDLTRYNNEYYLNSSIPVSPTSVNMTKVATAAKLSVTNNGWYYIHFDTPYIVPAQNNGKRLLVTVVNHTLSTENNGNYWRAFSNNVYDANYNSYYQARYAYGDSPIDAATTSSYGSSYVPNIQFFGNCDGGCLAPMASIVGTTNNSISVQWLANGSETSWQVEYKPLSSDTWTTATTATTNSYTITGLSAATGYNIRIGAICGDTMVYSAAVTGFTSCSGIMPPYSAVFTNDNPCWTSNLYTTSSDNGVNIYSDYYMISPEIGAPLDTLSLTFTDRCYGTSSTNQRYSVSACDADGNNKVLLATITATEGSSFGTHTIYLANYTGTQNHFIVESDGGDVYIKQIDINYLPACMPAINVVEDTATATSITLSWTVASSNAGFTVNYRPYGSIDSWSSATTMTNTITLTGLTASTNYEVQVITNCTDGSTMTTDEMVFATECVPVNTPYTMSTFYTMPACWYAYNTGHPNMTWASSIASGYGYVESYAGGSSTPINDWFITPAIIIPTTASDDSIMVVYQIAGQADSYSSSSVARYELLVSTNGGTAVSDFTDTLIVDTVNSTTFSYRRFSMSQYAGDTVIFAFHSTCTSYGMVGMYDFGVRSVLEPLYYISGNSTVFTRDTNTYSAVYIEGDSNSVTFSWTSTMAATGNAIMQDSTSAEMSIVYTAGGFDTIVMIATNAYGADTNRGVVQIFNCDIVNTFPFTEGFESDNPCWAKVYADGNTAVNTMGVVNEFGTGMTAHEGSKAFRFSSYSSTSDYNQYLISPELNGTNMVLSFWYSKYNTNMSERFRVGHSSTNNDTASFIWNEWVDSNQISNTSWNQYVDTLPNGTRYVAIQYWGDYAFYVYIDDLTITGLSAACEIPTIDSVLATETEILMNFSGDANNYEVAIVNGTWDSTTAVTPVAVTANTFTFTGLTAETQYSVGVRAVCAENYYSDWAITTVTTAVHPCAMPTGLNATNVTYTGATLTWSEGEEGQSAWQVAINGANFNDTVDVATTTYTVTGLSNGTDYTFSVRAVCSATNMSPWSAPKPFTTLDCQPVTNVHADNVTANSAVVSWTAPQGATNFEIEYGMSGFNQGNGTIVAATGTSHTLTGLSSTTVYDVYVRTVCGEGVTSAWSSVVDFTTADGEGIDDVNSAAISLYPNPASSTVTLTGIEGAATVTVVDMNGRETGKWTVVDGTLTIDVTEMAQGAYFVRIVGEQVNAIRKLIVR